MKNILEYEKKNILLVKLLIRTKKTKKGKKRKKND
jgi:hypothetical protein